MKDDVSDSRAPWRPVRLFRVLEGITSEFPVRMALDKALVPFGPLLPM